MCIPRDSEEAGGVRAAEARRPDDFKPHLAEHYGEDAAERWIERAQRCTGKVEKLLSTF